MQPEKRILSLLTPDHDLMQWPIGTTVLFSTFVVLVYLFRAVGGGFELTGNGNSHSNCEIHFLGIGTSSSFFLVHFLINREHPCCQGRARQTRQFNCSGCKRSNSGSISLSTTPRLWSLARFCQNNSVGFRSYCPMDSRSKAIRCSLRLIPKRSSIFWHHIIFSSHFGAQ